MNRAVPLRAVVFDFDGTLVNSLPLVLASIAHALEPYGRKPTMEIFARLGGPPERFLPLLLDDPRNTPDALARMDAYHRANQHLIELFDGAGKILDALKAAGIKTAIWTGRDRQSTELLLNSLGLAGHFATILCGDDLPSHKPDPEGLREIMRRLAVAPAATVFIGDADVDVLGGRACGVDTILIRHAREIAAEIVAQTWQAVDSPAEAFALVVRSIAAAPGGPTP
ncbi:MAG TPA: HAD family hydrolase [Opitutaceae bacterium]|nr:HAD family hydrolase [Opitutaceae bacterium]